MTAIHIRIALLGFFAALLVTPFSAVFAQMWTSPFCGNYYYPWGYSSCSLSNDPVFYASQISASAATAASAITPSFSYPTYYTYMPSYYYLPNTYYFPSTYYASPSISPFLSIGIGGTWWF